MNQQKVALITGAAGGIGKEIVRRFGKEGFHLVLSDIDAERLEAIANDLYTAGIPEDKLLLLPGDLSDLNYAKSLTDQCRQRWSRLDTLVNNAVWRTHDTLRTITEAHWEKTLRIGLTAPTFLAKWSAELMEEYKLPGTIINISSVQAGRAPGTSPAYMACKGAMDSLTYELASLYGPSGIRVVGVAPGNTLTPLSGDFVDESGDNISEKLTKYMEDQTPLARSAQPVEIANVVYWLSTGEASFVNGTVIEVDGGFRHGFGANSLKNIQFPGQF